MITDGFCMSPFTSCFYYFFVQWHWRKTDYNLMERVLGWSEGKNMCVFFSPQEIPLFYQRAPMDEETRLAVPTDLVTHSSSKTGSFQGITRHNAFCDASNNNTRAAIPAQKKRFKSNHLELFRQKQPHVDMQESNSRPSIYRTLPPSTASFSHHFRVRDFLSLLWFYPFSSCHEISSSRETSSLPKSRKYSGEHEHLCKLQNLLQ